jgi:hypothetical protein
MRSDRITPNKTWKLIHDTPNCLIIQDRLRRQGITGLIQAYENQFNSRQIIYTYSDVDGYIRIVYQLVDSSGNLTDDLSPPSPDLLDILSQMFRIIKYKRFKLEYHQSVWDYYKGIVNVEMSAPVVTDDIVSQVTAPPRGKFFNISKFPG